MSKTDQARDLNLLDYFGRVRADADDVRSEYLVEAEENLAFYMNYVNQPLPPGLEWMNSELLSDCFILAESVLPALANGALGNSKTRIRSNNLIGRNASSSALDFKTADAFRMLVIQGHLWQKNFYLIQYGERLVPVFSNPRLDAEGQPVEVARRTGEEIRRHKVYDGPYTQYPHLQNVWASPQVDWQGTPLVVIEQMPMNLDYMREFNKQYHADTGERFYRNLDEIAGNHSEQSYSTAQNRGFTPTPSGAISSRSSNAALASGMSDTSLVGSGTVMIEQNWGYVPRSVYEYDDTQYRLVITCQGKVLRDVKAPTPDLRSPYRPIKMINVADEPYGRSPMRWIINEVQMRSEMRNLRLAETWLNILKPQVARRDANWDQNDGLAVPGSVWMYDGPYNPNEVIGELKRSPVLQDVWREDSFAEQHMERAMSSTPHMQGQGLGQRATGMEAVLTDRRAGGRIDLTARLVSWQSERGALYDYLDLYRTFNEEPMIVQISGEDGAIPVQVLAEEIDFDVDIDIETEDFGPLTQNKLNAFQQSIGMFMQNPEYAVQLDPREVVQEVLDLTGATDVRRPQAEAEAIMEQMMAQQQAAAQAQAQPA